MVYLMLRNPFYYGYFEFPVGSGTWYKGSHEPLITKELFDEVQKELNNGHPPRIWGKKEFAYKGIFRCYSCGTSICGEEKYRKRKSGIVKHHIYYHCTKSRNSKCKEPFITEKELIKEIKKQIEKLDNEVISSSLNNEIKESLKQYEPIVKEINFYTNDEYEYDGNVSLKDLVLYASTKAATSEKRKLLTQLPIPKKLHNSILV